MVTYYVTKVTASCLAIIDISYGRESISWSMQPHCIPARAFSWTDLFLDRISRNETPMGVP